MNFVLVPAWQRNALGVTTAQLEQIASAVTVQLNRDAAPYWGGNHVVRVSSTGKDLQPGEVAFAIVDELPAAPGAVAYHDTNGVGVPVAFEALDMCSSVLSGSDSMAVAISHECLETIGDPACNAWCDDGNGSEYARELCDAVESSTYAIDGVDVSDFLLPAFFDPHAPGPFSFKSAASSPFTTSIGGYQIERSSGTGEHQVVAAARRPGVHACERGTQRHHGAKRRHWSSRAWRRGLR